MTVQSVDQVALAPAYLAALSALAVLGVDLVLPGRRGAVLGVGAAGSAAVAVAALVVASGGRRATFCTGGGVLTGGVAVGPSCSYVADRTGALVAVSFAVVALVVLGLSVPTLRAGVAPAGEYVFLLLVSVAGGVVLGYARDLVTLLVALETMTLPLYVLAGLRRRARGAGLDDAGGPVAAATGAVTFFVVSVVSTAVTLLGAALLYSVTGVVHLDRLAAVLGARQDPRTVPLTAAAVVLVLTGLAVKVAAVPFHAWAPGTYDGAPLPVAAYLSTASKLGGVVAVLLVSFEGLRPWLDVTGVVLAVLAAATMTVGNLTALVQQRMVRLLAWSSVAQAGYLLAPLGAAAAVADPRPGTLRILAAGTLGYTIFFLLLELGAFGAVVGLRGARAGGELREYRGAGRRHRLLGVALVLALCGLAGLPPGLAGLFAKATVVRATLEAGAGWLALAVGLNAVVGLAYYLRVAVGLYRPGPSGGLGGDAQPARVPVAVAGAVALVTLAAVVVGVDPQLVLDAAAQGAGLFG